MIGKKLLVGICCLIAITSISISYTTGVFVTTQTVSNSGSITAIGVELYWDSACTNPISAIDWGSSMPGSTQEKNIYVKNDGTINSMLNLVTSNWIPTLTADYMILSWNRENYILSAGEVVSAKLTLVIASDIDSGIADFSFDITITGTST